MNFKIRYCFLVLWSSCLISCGDCEQLNLNPDERAWIENVVRQRNFIYRSSNGKLDTLEIKDTIAQYTPCNKIELSEYQFEIRSIVFKLKSTNTYNGDEPSITMTTQSWQQRIPYLHFGDLGPHRNDLENSLPAPIDTVLNGIMLKSVHYYAKGLNTEQYGEKEYFKNFFWNKGSGLVAYTTMDDEVFIRIDP